MAVDHRRQDIDGLRAIAILAVVGYHIGLPGMAGGFVGVDVFLVISGYVITGLLLRQQRTTGLIGLKSFYARRIRRLLPGFTLAFLATVLLSAVLLLPNEQSAVAKAGFASALFVGNIHSWIIHQDYFQMEGQFPPFRHLWTLAVEEQFYVFFPVGMAILTRIGVRKQGASQRWILNFTLATILVSLGLSVALSVARPTFAYVMPITRAWEFGGGALLVSVPPVAMRLRPILAVLGLALIMLAILSFDSTTPFPSFYACLPVLGAMALIAGGHPYAGNPVGVLLASRPLRSLGRLSYGWYLWHWPLIAIGHMVWGAEAALARDCGLALLALILAGLSWHSLEQPVRGGHWASFATPRRSWISGALLITCCAAVSIALGIWALRPLPAGSLLAQYRDVRASAAHDFPFCNDGPGPACNIGTDEHAPTILLWGDSHATHLSKGFERVLGKIDARLIMRTMGGCTPAGHAAMVGPERQAAFMAQCDVFNARTMAMAKQMAARGHLRGVVIAGDWNSEQAGWSEPLAAHVEQLRAAGLRVVLVTDMPLMPPDFVTCAIRRGERACGLARATVEQASSASRATLNRIAVLHSDTRLWSLLDGLCPDQHCPPAINGRLLYRNRNHLSVEGSIRLAPSALPIVNWLVEAPARH